jgi:hypothetical protein
MLHKVGRTPRSDSPVRTNVLLSKKNKQIAYKMASQRGISIGRLLENLIEREASVGDAK